MARIRRCPVCGTAAGITVYCGLACIMAMGLAFLVAGCGAAGPGSRAVVIDSAGIEIVQNPAEDEPLHQTPVHIADLIPPDSALPATPWGMGADPATGRVYVADWQAARVVVFDRSGAFVEVLGRAGSGPGEFRNPSAVHVGPGGVLRVWDAGRGVISRWSPAGRFLGEDVPDLGYWGPGFAADSDRLVTVTGERTGSGMRMDQRLELERDGERATLYELPVEMSMLELPCVRQPGTKIFAPRLTWTSRGDHVYVLHDPDYRVDVYEDTALVTSIRRAIRPVQVTNEMAVEAVEAGATQYRTLLRICGVTAAQLARAVGHEEELTPVMGVALDPEGRLWVTRTRDGRTPGKIDIFDSRGAYLGTMDAPGVVVGFLSPTRFVTLRLDPRTGATVAGLYELDSDAARETAGAEAGSPGRATRSSEPAPRSRADADASPAAAWTPPPPDSELEPGDEFRDCPTCPVMVVLPPGHGVMGSPEGEAVDELPANLRYLLKFEQPQLEVTIDFPLAVGKYEVTFDQWDRCVEAGGCNYEPDDEGWGRGNRPVIHVYQTQTAQYLDWLSRETGKRYRLPSEAEWEYATRAETTTARYWGEDVGEGMAVCNGCGTRWDDRSTAPVGSLPPNDFGLYDTLGNASEWVSDCWTRGQAGVPTDGTPRREVSPYFEDGKCTAFVRRGGSFASFTWVIRSAYRGGANPARPWGPKGSHGDGFRVVRRLEIERGQDANT